MTVRSTATIVGIAVALLLVAALAWLTQGSMDPCSTPQADISAAVLADETGDQDALVNRAIILRSLCEPAAEPGEPPTAPPDQDP